MFQYNSNMYNYLFKYYLLSHLSKMVKIQNVASYYHNLLKGHSKTQYQFSKSQSQEKNCHVYLHMQGKCMYSTIKKIKK